MRSTKKRRIRVGKKSGRLGVICRQPVLWAATTAAMAATAGPRGRHAALRGSACYLLAAAVGNGIKPLFGRPQPRHRRPRNPHVMRGSFPSGHAAAEVAYTFGAAQELPAAFVLFGSMAMLGHWSLLRARKHYLSDMLVGGTLGLTLVLLMAKVWPSSPKVEFDVPARTRSLPSSSH
jgi:membrane-associated phospholipid phosphatase